MVEQEAVNFEDLGSSPSRSATVLVLTYHKNSLQAFSTSRVKLKQQQSAEGNLACRIIEVLQTP